jgi:exodeoxyribonuclease VII large subunit
MLPQRSPSSAWTVSALLLAVSDALSARFASVSVRGEISGFTRAASGHCYFTLKDAGGAQAGLRCAMFRRAASLLGFSPRDGQQVELRGRLAVYEARGELQMVVEAMQPLGTGSLYEEFLRLKARLEAQGLFAAERKRAMPAFPRVVAVVTSLAGAALHDVLTTLARRAPQLQVHVYPSLVQGPEAPPALVAALQAAGRDEQAEAVLLCRGGGSLEDLWSFNDERVVRAVAACPLPVLCGVGHETDITLCDLAADLRAATPTAAAELVCPATVDLLADLQTQAALLRRLVQRRLDGAAQRLDLLSLRLQRPSRLLGHQSETLGRQRHRAQTALQRALELARARQARQAQRLLHAGQANVRRAQATLELRQQRLAALDPRQVLARGYAWVTDEQGRPVVSVQGLALGQPLQAVWADGEAGVTVQRLPPTDA